jgi:hypothetical protein
VVEQAVDDADGELVALVAERRKDWQAEVEQAAEQAREEMRPAADTMDAALGRLSAMAGLREWLAGFPQPRGYQRPHLRLADLTRHSGEPHLAEDAVAALRALADPPARQPVARLHQPAGQRVKEGAA